MSSQNRNTRLRRQRLRQLFAVFQYSGAVQLVDYQPHLTMVLAILTQVAAASSDRLRYKLIVDTVVLLLQSGLTKASP